MPPLEFHRGDSVSGRAEGERRSRGTPEGFTVENGALITTVVVAVFVFFADPIEEAGFDWRSGVVAACDWMVGK